MSSLCKFLITKRFVVQRTKGVIAVHISHQNTHSYMHNNHIYLSRPTFRPTLVIMIKLVLLKMRY